MTKKHLLLLTVPAIAALAIVWATHRSSFASVDDCRRWAVSQGFTVEPDVNLPCQFGFQVVRNDAKVNVVPRTIMDWRAVREGQATNEWGNVVAWGDADLLAALQALRD